MKMKIFGCRGSAVVSRVSRYGGNTSCMSLESDGEFLILDAGSGLLTLENELKGVPGRPINILISHLHLDHIMGLAPFGPAWSPDADVRLFSLSRDTRPLNEQIFGAFSPPYWPLPMKDRSFAKCNPIDSDVSFEIGKFTVTPFDAPHPDKTLSYKITDGHSTVVYLLDSEVTQADEKKHEYLAKYCDGADLIVFDATYSSEDYIAHKGWGHSTVEDGIYFAKKWGCRQMLFSHFCRKYNDDELDAWKKGLEDSDCNYIFAHDGLELTL